MRIWIISEGFIEDFISSLKDIEAKNGGPPKWKTQVEDKSCPHIFNTVKGTLKNSKTYIFDRIEQCDLCKYVRYKS